MAPAIVPAHGSQGAWAARSARCGCGAGWRQEDLGRAVGRLAVGGLARGARQAARGSRSTPSTRLAAALDASIDLVLRWEGEGLDRLLDEGHARLVDVVVRRLSALGWAVAVEVSFSRYGSEGRSTSWRGTRVAGPWW